VSGIIEVNQGESMDADTLNAGLDFTRARLLGSLDAIEKSGQDIGKVLAWRPGPGRAHIAWQAMHCAATHDRYLNIAVLQKPAAKNEAMVSAYGGGSTPSDQGIPDLATIRRHLDENFAALREYVSSLDQAGLSKKITGRDGKERSIAEAITLLTWHEAHHQGQIHLTWNLYKAAHGMK
jgi:hypothetical protein